MAVTISQSVGEGGANKPPDLLKVDDLLRKIGLLENISPTPETRAAAIKRFQEIRGLRTNGKFDGKIDPNGTTLRKLNQTATKPTLNPIQLKKIGKGGYKISFTPEPPPRPYEVWLGIAPTPGEYIDITGCDHKDAMTPKQLPELLKLIQRHLCWGASMQLKVFIVLDRKPILESAPQPLACPVAPHNGTLLPLDEMNNGPALTYQGDADAKLFQGRWLQKVDGFSGYFFAYRFDPATGDSNFETNLGNRGFDCITYAGTTCGAPPTKIGATADLLAYLNPTRCSWQKQVPPTKAGEAAKTVTIELENADPDDIAEYFKINNVGYYIMWSGGHVVLVADGYVHEFSSSKKGYKWTNVQEWLTGRGKQSVRKLTQKPARAV